MAILEKEVLVGVGGSALKHYNEFGYNIPKYRDKNGDFRIKRGTRILVKIEHLPNTSTTKVTKVCDECGVKVQNLEYHNILKERKKGDGKDRCRECGLKLAINNRKNNIPFKKSLEYYAKINNKPYLLSEFSRRNSMNTNKIFKSSIETVWWNCSSCKSEYEMAVCYRTNGNSNCPYCSGQRVNEKNCLSTTCPEIAMLLEDKEIGFTVTAGSNKKERFICPDCGNTSTKKINKVVSDGFSCPYCSDNISYPEKVMTSILSQLEIEYEKEKVFPWSKKVTHSNKKLTGLKRYDFYLPNHNAIIEVHGGQHYNNYFNTVSKRTLNEEKENDDLKRNLAFNNGINKYLTINCSVSNLKFIKENILNSELTKLIKIDKINWSECDRFASKSIIKTICDIWNSNEKTISDIAKHLNMSISSVRNYLKKGTMLNMCDYDAEKNIKKVIYQLNLRNEVIKEWDSIKEGATRLGLHSSNIVHCCKNQKKTTGGFKWMYKEDYEEYIKQTAN